MKIGQFYKIILASFILVLFASCGDNSDKNQDTDELQDDTTQVNSGGVFNIGGELFSIPSPVQTAMLIQKTGAAYDKSMLNSSEHAKEYSTDFLRALNLGIYGADLGFASMYEKTQDALGYLGAVKRLADNLGVIGAFDQKAMERIQSNISVKDSMLVLVGIAYRASDAFLKSNKQTDISGLILTGGWLESLHFAISVNKAKENEDLKRRIAEQKLSLNSIIRLLSTYESQPEIAELVKDLKSLSKIYEEIEFKYVYEKPVTDANTKVTTINSYSEIKITKDQIESINNQVNKIRDKIIDPAKN